MCGLGDGIAQIFIERRNKEKYDVIRTARMTTIGLLFTVSIIHNGRQLACWDHVLDGVSVTPTD